MRRRRLHSEAKPPGAFVTDRQTDTANIRNNRMHLMHSMQPKIKNSSQGQSLRSNVTNFQSLLAFTMGHIPTKLHQFLTSSYRDFVRTDTAKDRQTPPKTIPARSMDTSNNVANAVA